jgi:hypothetical protein
MFRPLVGSGRGDEDDGYRGLKIFTSLKLRFQDFQRWNADKKAMAEIKTLTRELVNYGKEELSERTEFQYFRPFPALGDQ